LPTCDILPAVVTLSEGQAAVTVARAAIAAALSDHPPRDPARAAPPTPLSPLFGEPRGVFVTIKHGTDGALRGCIGFPVPVYPLRTAIPRLAVAAALEDPRFPPMRPRELGEVLIEVSILTVPEPIEATDPPGRLRSVVVGRDGLIVDAGDASGLLLPQVATEQGWDAATFLSETCRKAGVRADAWKSPATRLRRFQAEVFGESAPGGPVRPHPETSLAR
jgi:uncharacterized protein